MLNGPGGLPLELYHGSYKVIDDFVAKRSERVGGIYFTANIDEAWDYAKCACIEDGNCPTVMTVNLAISNPVRLTGIASQELTTEQIIGFLCQGFDGAVGVGDDGAIFEYVAFRADQVKLVRTEQNPHAFYLYERTI